jgi:allophanate hydrolase subunit 2
VLRVVLGPRTDRFLPEAVDRLASSRFVADARSNRVGLRLRGPGLERTDSDELLSEAVVTGALQVPGDGQPILLLADHPTTGGYPVIAVVVSADLPLAAQVRPGGGVRFTVAR